MAYIGRGLDKLSNIDVLDAITFTSSVGPYNITKSSTAFIPSAIQNLLIEVDGVIQASASYTISGSTITFGVSMSSSSTMNSFLHFGMGVTMTPADGTVSTVKIVDDAVTTAKILDDAVTTAKILDLNVTNAKLAGSIADAKITGLSSSKLTGALPAISGAALTALNATNIGSGTVPTARLGSGSASSSVFLAGDNTWAAAGGGKVGQVIHTAVTAIVSETTGSSWEDIAGFTAAITPVATSSKILILIDFTGGKNSNAGWKVVRATDTMVDGSIGDAAGSRIRSTKGTLFTGYTTTQTRFSSTVILDAPSSTSEVTYKVQWYQDTTGDYLYLNKNSVATDTDNTASHRARSGITLMEITA